MSVATTLEVRKIIRNLGIDYDSAWTDKCKDESMRLVAFDLGCFASEIEQKVVQMFSELGYENRIKITQDQYLRIKALKA